MDITLSPLHVALLLNILIVIIKTGSFTVKINPLDLMQLSSLFSYTPPAVSLQAVAAAQGLTPMENVFFSRMADDLKAMEELVYAITGVKVKLKEVVPQKSFYNFVGRSVILDLYAVTAEDSTLGPAGTRINIEVQGEKNSEEKRAIYNGAGMLSDIVPKSSDFSVVPNLVSIFICDFDALGSGEPLDYLYEICDGHSAKGHQLLWKKYFVNAGKAAAGSASPLQSMMRMFKTVDYYDDKLFPAFSSRKRFLLTNDQEVKNMAGLFQQLMNEKDQAIKDKDQAVKDKDQAIKDKDQLIQENQRLKSAVAAFRAAAPEQYEAYMRSAG